MSDVLSHFHLMNYRARAVVAITTEVIRQAQKLHQLDPLTTIALGRAISSVSLLASTLKHQDEYVHSVFTGGGVLKKIVAECNGDGQCRGYCTPGQILRDIKESSLIPQSVGDAMGPGNLTITRGKYGDHKPYVAVVELLNGEIATDVANFLSESEQIPSAVAAGVKLGSDGQVLAAGGMLIQKLGGAQLEEDELTLIESKMSAMQISETIFRDRVPEALIKELQIDKQTWGLLTNRSLKFQCRCSREKMALTAMSLGEAELREIVAEIGKIELNCAYCSSTHKFGLEELIKH